MNFLLDSEPAFLSFKTAGFNRSAIPPIVYSTMEQRVIKPASQRGLHIGSTFPFLVWSPTVESLMAIVALEQLAMQHEILMVLATMAFDPGTGSETLPEPPKKIIGFH